MDIKNGATPKNQLDNFVLNTHKGIKGYQKKSLIEIDSQFKKYRFTV